MDIITNEAALNDAGFYWRTKDKVTALVCSKLEQDGFTNGFSTRLGGVSPMPHEALNLAGFDDDTAANIHENRQRFLRLVGGKWTLATSRQMHGCAVHVIKDPASLHVAAAAATDATTTLPRCDALVTNIRRVLLAVKTADCVPVLLGDSRTNTVAAIHAGWRGTLKRIVPLAIKGMQEAFGTRSADVCAAIGPAASACCYEVGSDVIEGFHQNFPQADALFTPTREGHARIDLQRANRELLIEAGVTADRIYTAPLCTMCRTDLFFSYRQEKNVYGRTGRLLAAIGRVS